MRAVVAMDGRPHLAQAKIELQLALQKDLVKQILTPTEQDLLAKLRSMFSL